MDVLELLKQDHAQVNSLFDQIKTLNERAEVERLYRQARTELLLHASLEESDFYPVFKKFPEMQSLLKDAYDDHSEAKRMIKVIDEEIRDGENPIALIHDLIEAVTHHVHEEENEFFPAIRKLMKRPEREILGRHLQAAKEQLRTQTLPEAA